MKASSIIYLDPSLHKNIIKILLYLALYGPSTWMEISVNCHVYPEDLALFSSLTEVRDAFTVDGSDLDPRWHLREEYKMEVLLRYG